MTHTRSIILTKVPTGQAQGLRSTPCCEICCTTKTQWKPLLHRTAGEAITKKFAAIEKVPNNTIWKRVGGKIFRLNFLSRIYFYMVKLTVFTDISWGCCAKKATTVLMFNNTRTKYQCGCRVDGNETKNLLVHCEDKCVDADRRKKFCFSLFAFDRHPYDTKIQSQFFCFPLASIG